MKDRSHIEEAVAKEIPHHLNEMPAPSAKEKAGEIVDFYKNNYPKVQIVRCEKCGADLCLEVQETQAGTAYLHSHHEGLRRITLGSSLLSSRKRLDGIMGYQCICGNDTLNAKVELGVIPTVTNPLNEQMIPVIEPHHEAAVKIQIAKTGYKPDVNELSPTKKILEKAFSVEVL